MKFLSVFFYDGKRDVKVYLDCLSSQVKHCQNYSVLVNKAARELLEPLGIDCIDYEEVIPSHPVRNLKTELDSIISLGKYAAVSDILRIWACKKFGDCCYLDGDIYLKCSIDSLQDKILQGQVLVGAENGGYICSGFLMNKSSRVVDLACEEILSSKKMSSRWQMYCGILFGKLLRDNPDSVYVLNPVVLMGVYYKNFKKFIENGELIDMEKYWSANPRALGLHVCGASMNVAQNVLKNNHSTLYSPKYYLEEFPTDDILSYDGDNLALPETLSSTPRFLYKEGMLK